MNATMIKGLLLTSSLLAPAAFASQKIAHCGEGEDSSWLASTHSGWQVETATVSISLSALDLDSETKQDQLLLTNDGSKLLIDGENLKLLRVSGTSKACHMAFGRVGVSCELADAVVTLLNADGQTSVVSTTASVMWINSEILLSLGSSEGLGGRISRCEGLEVN